MAGGEREILARDGNSGLQGPPLTSGLSKASARAEGETSARVRPVRAIGAVVQDGPITDATGTDPMVAPDKTAEYCRHHQERGFHVTALVIVSDKLVAVEVEPAKPLATRSTGVAKVV